jgi:hypothetical protein
MTKIATITMHYCTTNKDSIENNEWKFYPFLSDNKLCENNTTDIDFELMVYKNELLWAQQSERIITCLEPKCGAKLLQILNEAYCVNAVKILNRVGNVLYPSKEKFD